jgi:hypothetical protein
LSCAQYARSGGEGKEQLVFLLAQLYGVACHEHAGRIEVHVKLADVNLRRALGTRLHPPTHVGANPREELRHRERLGHVVVGTGV